MTDTSQNSHEEKADDQAKAEPTKKEDKQARLRRYFSMSNFIIAVTFFVAAVFISIAINYHTKGGYGSIRMALLWGIASYAVLGIATYFAYYEYVVKPARALERTRQKADAERTLLSERPELFVESVYPEPFVTGHPNRMRLQIANRGRTTAHQVKLRSTHAVLPSDFKGPLAYVTQPPDSWHPIGAGARFDLTSVASWNMTAWHVTEILAQRAILFFYGKGTYQDEGGRVFSFQFCTMFKASMSAMVVCPESLWPKEQTADAQIRPLLAVEGARLVKLPDGRGHVEITVRNSGQEAAQKATVYTSVWGTPIEEDRECSEPKEAPLETMASVAVIGIGERRQGGTGVILTKEQIVNIEKGVTRLYVYLISSYEGLSGGSYSLRYYGRYDAVTHAFHDCPTHNEST
jgi:hypothetical protein